MDLYLLDTSHRPTQLIEGWDSLIWTERYRESGDFELITSGAGIKKTLDYLGRGGVIGVSGSREIMFVEQSEISLNEDGVSELKVTGRSFEALTDYRITFGGAAAAQGVTVAVTYTSVTSAQAVINLLTRVLTSTIIAQSSYRFTNYSATSSLYRTLTTQDFIVARGQAYPELKKLLEVDDLGIRNARPDPTSTSTTFSSIVYTGQDRSATIIFDVRAGHFQSANYVYSDLGFYKNMMATNETSFTNAVGFGSISSYISNPPYSYRQGMIDINDGQHTGVGAVYPVAQSELQKYPQTKLISGKLSPDIPYVYGTDFVLGDLVTIIGEYNDPAYQYIPDGSFTSRIVEYTRAQTKEGEVAFPTLG